ncbi:MAG: 50S ribosomal protein L23 [Firmicutes bacterium]|jgi:large subunit ribosomal protein L23|nr:50S ribosomal protein L23 [Bacillota bacterium]
MADLRSIIRRPVISERTMDLMQENKYTFEVDIKATKPQIREAVEQVFNVDVVKVNTMRVTGKVRRMGRSEGKRPDWKKAIVTVKEGQRIELFEGL